jgi:maltooligosyltrehalose trehalohydrolase
LSHTVKRRYPIGAEVHPEGVHVRVWAQSRQRVAVVLEGGGETELTAESKGYFSGLVPGAHAGTRYRFRLDGGATLYPDPASRFQPEGPHGPSEVVDPAAYHWGDDGWPGASLPGQVLYELHVGTFTKEGSWSAAERELPALAELGITTIEVMPVADFAGEFGWGYDGVDLFAPTRLYGRPDDMRRFVDRAHQLGIGVILDVVYNHLGPDGNYLSAFARDYFTDRYETDWGAAINFDGRNAEPVRELFRANAAYWVDEFHLDGLRLDATQAIYDRSRPHVIKEIRDDVRKAARGRATIVVAENEPQEAWLVRPPKRGGAGLDAVWNDDFHHSAMVALTGRGEAYYSDTRGSPQELISAAKRGWLFQGQRYAHQAKRRGTFSFDLPPAAFITFIQNHDQVANAGSGARVHALTSPGLYRAMTALLLLMPGTPMLFQGQEFAASAPFLYFADHTPELAALVWRGRNEFLRQFPSLDTAAMRERLPNPGDRATFERSKLDHCERERNAPVYALHRDLLALRRQEQAFRAQRLGGVDGAVLGPEALVLRFFDESGDRLLLVNLGRDLTLVPAPEPLLAPPDGMRWSLTWSSEHPRYGGTGTPEPESEEGWRIQGQAAAVLAPVPREETSTG